MENVNSNSESIDLSIFQEEGAITPELVSDSPPIAVDSSYSTDVSSLLSKALSINENNLFHESSCKICASAYRRELEKKWIETKKIVEIQNLYKNKEGKKLAESFVENHMTFHLGANVRELRKEEYINRIQRLTDAGSYLTTLERIKMDMAVIDDKIASVNSLTPTSEISLAEVEKIQVDAAVKLVNARKNILMLRNTIESEMRERGDLLTIPKDRFISVFLEAHSEAASDEGKKIVMDLLTTFKQYLQGNMA